MIPIAKPLLGQEEIDAVVAVLRSGNLVQGALVEQFERRFLEVIGGGHAVAVSSGTAALHLALLAHGIGHGDEVITTPFTFVASANSVLYTGARPVFVDICGDTFNIDPDLIEEKITPRTKAIVPVHLYGHPADMEAIGEVAARHGLMVIEDAAQAHGAAIGDRKIGTFGTACFSFYATKNVTMAEGGLITTDDEEIAERLRLLRSHGQRERYHHEILGFNFRLTDIQAAIGLVQLERLEQLTDRRIANAEYLNARLSDVITPRARPGYRHVYHQYTVRVPERRDDAVGLLREAGIGTGVHYPIPIHQQPLYRNLGYKDHLPEAEKASREVLSLPVHPSLSGQELDIIVREVSRIVNPRPQPNVGTNIDFTLNAARSNEAPKVYQNVAPALQDAASEGRESSGPRGNAPEESRQEKPGDADAALKALIDRAARQVRSWRRVLVTTHRDPDGDALGASLGLTLALRASGYDVTVVNADPPRATNARAASTSQRAGLAAIPGAELIITWQQLDDRPFDGAVLVDCSTLDRLHSDPETPRRILERCRDLLVIDHHAAPSQRSQTEAQSRHEGETIRIVDSTRASSAELVALLIEAAALPLEREIATALMTGVATDTKGFLRESTDPRALASASRLRARGGDVSIAADILQGHSVGFLILARGVLARAVFIDDGAGIVASVPEDLLASSGVPNDEIEALTALLSGTREACVVILLQAQAEEIRGSVRTRAPIDAVAIARRFGGGGHASRAGFRVPNAGLDDLAEKASVVVREVLASMKSPS